MFFSSATTLGSKSTILSLALSLSLSLDLKLAYDCFLVNDREFVNSVWSIRILSPQEVQQMGKQGVSSTQAKGLPSTSGGGGGGGLDDYVNHRSASRGGLSTGIMSVGAFDY